MTERRVTVVYTDGACSGNPGPGGWAWAEPGGAWACGHGGAHDQPAHGDHGGLRGGAKPPRTGPDRDRLDLRHELLREALVRELAEERLEEQPAQAGGEPRPVGAVRRALRGSRRRDHLPVGEGPQRRPDERPRRPAGRPGLRHAAAGGGGAPARSGHPRPARRAPRPVPVAVVGGTAPAKRDGRVPDGHRLAAFGAAPPELGGWEANPVADRRPPPPGRAASPPRRSSTRTWWCSPACGSAPRCWRPRRPSTPGSPTWRCCRTPSRTGRGPRRTAAGSPSWSRRPGRWSRSRRSAPDAGPDFRNALARRDGWLAANAHEAVLVWDGDDRSLAELHRKLVNRLGEEEVWVLAP